MVKEGGERGEEHVTVREGKIREKKEETEKVLQGMVKIVFSNYLLASLFDA